MIGFLTQKKLIQESQGPLGGKIFVLELLGIVSLRNGTRPVPVAAQQRRPLGLLAILALGGSRGLSRDRIETYLWPESDAARARHALDQVVYAIRQALGSESILSVGRELRLNPELIRADVWEFDEAIRSGRWAEAVEHHKGPLLDGFHTVDSRELETWIDAERGRVLQAYQAALERLANLSAETADHSQSVAWWRKLVGSDPLSAKATKQLILALAAAGNRAGAVKQARLYQELVRQELEMEPDADIEELATSLSRPATNGGVRIAPPIGHSAVDDAAVRNRSPESASRTKRSRAIALLAFAGLLLVLVGSGTVGYRLRNDRPTSGADGTRRMAKSVGAPSARESYLRGLDAWGDGTKAGLESAVVHLLRATELDPQYADAYAALADAYVILGYFGYRTREEVFPKAKAAALRSVELDSTLASAHPALAYELTWERDFTGANTEFQKAIALAPTHASRTGDVDPTYAKAHQWYAILLMILAEKPDTGTANRGSPKQDPFSLNTPIIKVSFTKWITDYPTMSGFTSNGPGTLSGQVLSRIDDGVFTHMIVRYEITDPVGSHAFKAVMQGKVNDKTGEYDLNGIVTWGWLIGWHVNANFQRITPCEFGKHQVCFVGTIRIRRV